MSQLQDEQAESILFSTQPFCSTLAFKEQGKAHPHWVELSALLYLHIQMLISSKKYPYRPTQSKSQLNIWAQVDYHVEPKINPHIYSFLAQVPGAQRL